MTQVTRCDGPDARSHAVTCYPCKRASLEDVRLHDLRHSFASVAVAGGDSLYLVGKVLGHRQSATTERYAHLADDPLQAVANRTAATIAAAMSGSQKACAEVVELPKRKA